MTRRSTEAAVQRRVVCAALRDNLGRIVTSPRHFDAIMVEQIQRVGRDQDAFRTAKQGFVDQRGEFLTRTEAWVVAQAAGQIIRRVGGDTLNGGNLFSENLY